MNYKENTVAKITKIYAVGNLVVSLLSCCMLFSLYYVDIAVGIILIAASIVINFGIYIIGEVIQLLDDIKQNTSGKVQAVEAESNAADVSNE